MNNIHDEIKNIDKEMIKLQNQRYKLNEEFIKMKYKECQKNIGRCFVDRKGYYHMITKTSKIEYQMRGGSYFNEYVYETMSFSYPYNNSIFPFYNDEINICPASIRDEKVKEIYKNDLMSRFNKVNCDWIKALSNQ